MVARTRNSKEQITDTETPEGDDVGIPRVQSQQGTDEGNVRSAAGPDGFAPIRPGRLLRTFLFRFFVFLVLRVGNHSWKRIQLSLLVNSLCGFFRCFYIWMDFWLCMGHFFWIFHYSLSPFR